MNTHCIEIFFTVHDFWATCPCPEKIELPWNFSLYWIYLLYSVFLTTCACPVNRICPENFHCIEYTFYIQDFWATLRVPWKQSCLAFNVLNTYIYIQDFWATCGCPENRMCPEIFTLLNILFTFRIFEQLALALKTECPETFTFRIFEQLALALKIECPEIFHCTEYTFYIQDFWATSACPETECPEILAFRIFEQLALALKKRVCPENFHCVECTFHIQDFWATCACPENRVCPEIFHCIEYTFCIQDFWATCACPEKQSVPWNFLLYWIYFFQSGFRSNLRLPWNTTCVLKFFTVLNILFPFRISEQLTLALKNNVCPEIFHCIEYTFYIQDFWATCAYPQKQRVSWSFLLYWIYFLHSGFLSSFALALKNRVALNSLYGIYFLHSGFLSNLRLPWKTECALSFFTVLNILFTFRIFEQLAFALKDRVALNSLYGIYFLHSGFLSNLRLPWKTECAL